MNHIKTSSYDSSFTFIIISVVDDDTLEGWSQLEEIFRQQATPTHQRILQSDVYICPILDLHVWNGSCVLKLLLLILFNVCVCNYLDLCFVLF